MIFLSSGERLYKSKRIDSLLFDLYGLTEEERKVIGFVEIV